MFPFLLLLLALHRFTPTLCAQSTVPFGNGTTGPLPTGTTGLLPTGLSLELKLAQHGHHHGHPNNHPHGHPPASTTTSDHATVTIIASDGNGLHKGDFVISMPPELGEKLALTLHRLSHCPSSKKRSALLDCVGANAVGVIQAANGGAGELAGLIIAPTRMPDLAPALAAVLQTVIRNGRQFQGALSNADYNRLAEVAFMVTYASIVLKEAVNVPNPTEWVFPASGIATSSAPTSSSSCPPDRSRPCCVNCGGNNGNLKCKGIASAGNAWKGCPCLEPVQYPYRPFENKQAFLDAQKELASLPDRTTTSAPPSAPTVGGLNCNQISYADGCHRNDVHKSYVDKLADYMGQGFTADFTPDTRNFTREMRKGGTSGSGVTYLMNVGWIQGCTSQKSQKLARPIDPDQDFDWQGLLKRTYYSCTDNNGLGGYVNVGCLRYGFYPNKFHGLWPNSGTPNYQAFWDKMHYC